MFRDNDVICFLGDSITAGGLWMGEVYQVLRKKYKLRCFNCGVSGGAASRAERYLHANCLIYNPDYVVINFGVNDSGSWLLSKTHEHVSDKKEQLDKFFNIHKECYESIVKECTERGVKVIIALPVPYDEISDFETENLKCQFLLDRMVEFQKELAVKYNCAGVDFTTPFKERLGKAPVIREDRVHPTPFGYHAMAQIFLRDTGEISECDFDTPFEFEPWNLERYNAEQILHKINYVEYCDLFELGWAKGTSSEEKKKIARERYDKREIKDDFISLAYLEYIDKNDNRAKLIGDVVRLTI